jgi:hypothetical protein
LNKKTNKTNRNQKPTTKFYFKKEKKKKKKVQNTLTIKILFIYKIKNKKSVGFLSKFVASRLLGSKGGGAMEHPF